MIPRTLGTTFTSLFFRWYHYANIITQPDHIGWENQSFNHVHHMKISIRKSSKNDFVVDTSTHCEVGLYFNESLIITIFFLLLYVGTSETIIIRSQRVRNMGKQKKNGKKSWLIFSRFAHQGQGTKFI